MSRLARTDRSLLEVGVLAEFLRRPEQDVLRGMVMAYGNSLRCPYSDYEAFRLALGDWLTLKSQIDFTRPDAPELYGRVTRDLLVSLLDLVVSLANSAGDEALKR